MIIILDLDFEERPPFNILRTFLSLSRYEYFIYFATVFMNMSIYNINLLCCIKNLKEFKSFLRESSLSAIRI